MEESRKHRSAVSHFTDLELWQLARQLAREVYEITSTDPLAKDYAMAGQVRRSVISVSSNIAEGFERGGNPEFIHFLFVAKGSCGELESQLLVSADLGYLAQDRLQRLRALICRISAMIRSLVQRLKESEYQGWKKS
ncbi:MAG: four helix bundle protein [Acidobacteriota bacterium]